MEVSIMSKLDLGKYNAKTNEKEIFDLWQKERIYAFDPTRKGKTLFSIDTPPPYTNASWHLGSTVHYLSIDMIARMQRMKGFNVHFPMGLDRNGLPIEIATEKKFKVNMHKIPREEFLELCKKTLDEAGAKVLDLCYKIGMSCNSFEWDKVYKTDYPEYRAITQATFIEMWKRGLVLEDDRPNNWDHKLQTTIADAEIEYKEGTHELHDIEFEIPETGEKSMFATTRPELIPAIRVIVYHPDDKRYQHLEGKTAKVPLWNIEVPIRAHPAADPEFGTGMMQVCSYGDITDVRILREFGIGPVYAINTYGKLTEATGKYKDMNIKKGREAIVADLKEIGAIKASKEVPHRYPTSERSGATVEFIGMNEYYLTQEAVVDKLREYSDILDFHPEFSRQIWKDWLDRISMDWPISRRRFYGTEVPVWYCKKCNHAQVPEPGPYYQPWKEDPPFEKCEECGNNAFKGDSRTFDTWMDSSISPLYISKYPNNVEDLELFEKLNSRPYLADIRPQGKDIVRTWLHYTMLRIHHLYNKPAFKHAWISGHVVLESGEKMSKSKKGVAPEPIVEKYGGDAIRLFGAMEASHGSDVRFSENRLKGGSKFLNKLYNIARFISAFDRPKSVKTFHETDKWILNELAKTQAEAMSGYDNFDAHPAARALRNFTQEIFASHYIEMVKNRAYNREDTHSKEDQGSAIETLYICLDAILKLFAPIIPFITDYIYRKFNGSSIHTTFFPDLSAYRNESLDNATQLLTDFNSAIWSVKSDNGLSLRDGLPSVSSPVEMEKFHTDLGEMHGVGEWLKPTSKKGKKIELNSETAIQVVLPK